jgi:glycosyltransferase involved in cell wall biosynthesis
VADKQVRCLAFLLGFGLKESNLFGPLSETFMKMAEIGHQFHVVTRTSSSKSAENFYEYPSGGYVSVYKITHDGFLGKVSFLIKLPFIIFKITYKNNINIVYSHIIQSLAMVSLLVGKILNIPVVYWICSHWPKEIHMKTPFVRRTIGDLMHTVIMRFSDNIFTCTEFCRDTESSKLSLPIEKFYIFPNAVNVSRFNIEHTEPSAREIINKKYNIKVASTLILYFSSLSERKGAIDLVESIPLIQRKSGKSFFILFCGSSEVDMRHLQGTIKKQDNLDIVKFTGRITSEDAPLYYNSCDIFCVPARYEGFGRVYVEAMAAKKPVITTNVGGIPEVVDDQNTGILVESKSPTDLSDKISYLLENPDFATDLGENGYKKAIKQYDQTVVSKLMANYMRDIVYKGIQ